MEDMTLSELRDMCQKIDCTDCSFRMGANVNEFYDASNYCIFVIRPYDWKIGNLKKSATVINEDKKEIAEKIGELVDSILAYKGANND